MQPNGAGDAATIEQPRALDFADELFVKYDRNGDDRLQLEELQALLQEASERFPHLKEHATFLEGYVEASTVMDDARCTPSICHPPQHVTASLECSVLVASCATRSSVLLGPPLMAA